MEGTLEKSERHLEQKCWRGMVVADSGDWAGSPTLWGPHPRPPPEGRKICGACGKKEAARAELWEKTWRESRENVLSVLDIWRDMMAADSEDGAGSPTLRGPHPIPPPEARTISLPAGKNGGAGGKNMEKSLEKKRCCMCWELGEK